MKAGSVFGSYLKAGDLGGRKVAVKIAAWEVAEFDDGKKLVLSFAGKDKKLAVNLTNCNTIIEILGTDETDQWIGHVIVLRPDRTMFGAKMVDCVRVEAYVPAQAPRPSVAPPPPPVTAPVSDFAHDGGFQADYSDVPFAWLLPILAPALIVAGSLA
jgi:hypothetical protein